MSAMLASVRPRVFLPESGDSVLLEEVVEQEFERQRAGEGTSFLEIAGPPGSGKSTALNHLAACFNYTNQICFIDHVIPPQLKHSFGSTFLVYTLQEESSDWYPWKSKRFQLAGWNHDDFIEYLLKEHPQECGSVMQRIQGDPDAQVLGDSPAVWKIVLDRMATDPAMKHPPMALYYSLRDSLQTQNLFPIACAYSVLYLTKQETTAPHQYLKELDCDEETFRLLRDPFVQLMLASDLIETLLREGYAPHCFRQRLPDSLLKMVACTIEQEPIAKHHLRTMAENEPAESQAMIASLLNMVDADWKPSVNQMPYLKRAMLENANFSNLKLIDADLEFAQLNYSIWNKTFAFQTSLYSAELQHSDFRNANLINLNAKFVKASDADFSHAKILSSQFETASLIATSFEHASLHNITFHNANLSQASFRNAIAKDCDFYGANLSGVDLTDANLKGSTLREIDFTQTKLGTTNFSNCNLIEADFGNLKAVGLNFHSPYLLGANFTYSNLHQANFTGADLKLAKLGAVNWRGADFQNASLEGASFHFGSTRSGTLSSPYASEGTRTGYYTDDAKEQFYHYQSPETVRKANLRDVNLIGATIDMTDFYLVDLRGAYYTQDQEWHLRKCGAILDDWEGIQ